jgi:hypothetical protein
MKRLFKFKYPKIAFLIIAIAFSYLIFRNPHVSDFVSNLKLGSLSYLGVFIAGILFSFGFTAPFAAGFFITLNPSNILLAGLVGAIGSSFGNVLMFKVMYLSFKDEFKRIEKTKVVRDIEKIEGNIFNKHVRLYLMYIFMGFLIASPLPDEVGVMMLSGLTKINIKIFALLSLLLHFIGIVILLLI